MGFLAISAMALSAAISGSILAEGCKGRALMPLDVDGAKSGDMRPLRSLRLKCSGCEAQAAALSFFVTRAEADSWATRGYEQPVENCGQDCIQFPTLRHKTYVHRLF
jgi:hypothetical protein